MWIRADMGPREIGVLFLYLGESRQEGAFLLADLAGSKNRGTAPICPPQYFSKNIVQL